MKNNRRQLLKIILLVVLCAFAFPVAFLLFDNFFGTDLLEKTIVAIMFLIVPAIATLGPLYYIITGIYRVCKGQNVKKSILLIAVGIVFLLFIGFSVLIVFDVLKSGTLSA